MKRLLTASVLAATASVVAMTSAPALSQAAQAGTPTVPIEVWSLRNVINSVQVSPNGEYVLVLKTESRDGDHVLEIYRTADMTKPFRRVNADPMELISASWASDSRVYGTAWQVRRSKVKEQEGDVRDYMSFSYDPEKNKFLSNKGFFNIVSSLPKEPNHVLVTAGSPGGDGLGVDPGSVFRSRSFYKLNLDTGAKELALQVPRKYSDVIFDIDGNPRYTTTYEANSSEEIQHYRLPGDGSWKEFGDRYDFDKHENLYRVLGGVYGIKGFSEENPNIAYVVDPRGEDKAALWEYDFSTQTFGKKLFGTDTADVMGIMTSSMPDSNKLVAAVYPGEKWERHWFDEEEKALYEQLEAAIPHAHQVSISSRSRDGKTMVVQNSGPRDPGSFWLVRDGSMVKLGSRNPLLQPEQLADVEFIRYPARDGKMIPGYVTKPKGEGPFPLIVLPHGGPHVPEVIGYDEWGQLLANAGYMVLQPGYRMTVGWGKDHFDSAYGEHGLAMQDDKDDGALYLVEKGLVDPDRIAMFGWSYGGYAALVAASREDNIYQCTIAGAAVSDPAKWRRLTSNPYSPKALDDWSARRGGEVGINPINEVSKVNIPLLMVHGDVDARVLYYHYTDYKAAMEKAGKTNAQYLTLKGADHFSRTLMYEHQEAFYTKMLDYLKNDCGPGGL